MQGVADDAGRGLELALSLGRISKEFWERVKMAEWKVGEEGEIGFFRLGRSERNPRGFRHERIVAKRCRGEIERAPTDLDFGRSGLGTFRAGADGAEMVVGIDAGGVAVGEGDLDGVVSYLRGSGGAGFGLEHWQSGRRREGG